MADGGSVYLVVEREDKNRLGWLAYIGKVIQNWFGRDSLKMWINVGGARFSFRAVEIPPFNTSHVGIIDEDLDADIRLDDDVLDLYAVRSRSLWNMLRMLIYCLAGKPKEAPYIKYWRVRKKVEIRSEQVISFSRNPSINPGLAINPDCIEIS